MSIKFQRALLPAIATIILISFTPGIAAADGHGYGYGDNFSAYSGAGYDVHHGDNGETDVNTCSNLTDPGILRCTAQLVTQASARNAPAAIPSTTSSNVSACGPGDTNAPAAAVTGGNGAYDPCYLQSAYNAAALAQGNGGKGQIVAIVDYTVDPNIVSDLNAYRAQFGIPACTSGGVSKTNTSCVIQQVAQSGAPTSGRSGWDVEISLDVQAVSAICPNCQILLMEASQATSASLGSAVNTAVSMGAIAVSNSYGGAESSTDPTDAATYYTHPGVAVTASSGDTAGQLLFPATAPDVIAVGGTSLLQQTNTGSRSSSASEKVWNNTSGGAGAGCSARETPAQWQSSFMAAALTASNTTSKCANRVTADISALADPSTGFWVYDTYSQGGWLIVGGTSLASPIIAALYGLENNASGSTVHPAANLYANSTSFYHVTSGNVGTCANYLCDATKSISGYNGPTGLGTPGAPGSLAAFVFNPAVAPSPPTGLAVSSISPTSVTLSWPAVSGATSYSLYSGTAASSLTLNTQNIATTSITVSGLTTNTNYYFALTATNSLGTSAQSSPLGPITPALSVPGAPSGLSAVPSNGSVSLSWTAPNNGGSAITGYTIKYATTPGGAATSSSSISTASTSATVNSLVNGTTYYFQVLATNAKGSSALSNEVSATPAGIPNAVSTLVGTPGANGSGKATLTWTAPASSGSALTGYAVYYGTTPSPTTLLSSPASTTTSLSISGLTSGTTYYFDIVAKNAIGSSAISNIVQIVDGPGAPTNVKATASGTSVNLTWTAPSGTGISYKVQMSLSSNMANSTTYPASGTLTSTSYSVLNLTTTTRYYFAVVATNAGGSSTSAVVTSLG